MKCDVTHDVTRHVYDVFISIEISASMIDIGWGYHGNLVSRIV